ncbi:MAG: hypothetical protein WD070_08410 [Pirellulaceae bacterium]
MRAVVLTEPSLHAAAEETNETDTENIMNIANPLNPITPYKVRQLDTEGQVLSEKQVTAPDSGTALRQLKDVFAETQRIEVYNDDGEKAGEMDGDYWRQRVRRR